MYVVQLCSICISLVYLAVALLVLGFVFVLGDHDTGAKISLLYSLCATKNLALKCLWIVMVICYRKMLFLVH